MANARILQVFQYDKRHFADSGRICLEAILSASGTVAPARNG
jgi:hypothetical protein